MNFEFYNPTHLIFGAGTISRLGEVAGKHGKKALIAPFWASTDLKHSSRGLSAPRACPN